MLAVGDVRSLFVGVPALAQGQGERAGGAYGVPVRDPAGILDLPRRFAYRIVSRAGERMSNGPRCATISTGPALRRGW